MAGARSPSTSADSFRLTMMIFAVIAAMYFTGEVLKPLALAILLCFALAPAVRLLERARLPRAAAVIFTVFIALTLLGGIGFVVGKQLTALANHLPDYQGNIEDKLQNIVKPDQKTASDKLKDVANEVTAKIEKKRPSAEVDEMKPIQKVEVVAQTSFQERLRSAGGPYLSFLGVGSFVLILVLFMLMAREDLIDRIVLLFGSRQVSLTTRTMEEIGRRISRYLATFAMVNSGYGLVIGLGLGWIGVPYAVLWGSIAAMLRFIPYVGPAAAFALPLIFSFAYFPGWIQPLEVAALFGVVEALLNSFLEPVIYGKTTGVSALSLLIAAMFWTWLWGTLGLLLSTPMTVCLAVLGKYVPSLGFFAVLLGEEADLPPDVRFYQRLVALDRDGAMEVVEEAMKQHPRVEIFDRILIPALIRAERDSARNELGDQEREFARQVVGGLLEKLEGTPEYGLSSPPVPPSDGKAETVAESAEPTTLVMGLAARDASDVLALKMLAQLLRPAACRLEIVADTDSPLRVAERVAEISPKLVVVSHLPPEGLTSARYLVKRLRARFADLPILATRWGETGGSAAAAERLSLAGATRVVFTLAKARDHILKAAGLALPDPAAALKTNPALALPKTKTAPPAGLPK